MKTRQMMIVGLIVFCCLSWLTIVKKGTADSQSKPAITPLVKCDSWGCTIENALTDAALAQVKGKLTDKALTLKNITNDDLKLLPKLKDELTQLVMESKGVSDITPLGELTGLTSVELTLENLADCAPLAKLVNLKKLRINYGKYKSFDFLKPLNTLENLFLYMPPPEPSTISSLAGKTKLKQLALGDANITDITPLKDAASLEFLSLYGTKVADLKPLAALKSLRRLMLSKIPAKDLSPVGQLAELTELTIDQTDFADYTPLAKCTKLRTLQAQLSTLDKLDIIKTMPELRSLDVLNDAKAQQWEALKTAKNLDFLQIAKTSFSDLSLIAHMDKLRYLYIGNTTVIHPEAISALPELGTLGIVETQGISDVSIFKTLPKLETLYIKKGQFPQAQLDALKAANSKLRFSEY